MPFHHVYFSVLEYWAQHRHRFPNIHTIARKVLAIPASNTEVERLFSCSKMSVTDTRTRLDTEKLNKLIFLRKNLHLLKMSDAKEGGRQKRKSTDQYESDSESEHEGEQLTPSISKKRRIEIDNVLSNQDRLNE